MHPRINVEGITRIPQSARDKETCILHYRKARVDLSVFRAVPFDLYAFYVGRMVITHYFMRNVRFYGGKERRGFGNRRDSFHP